MAGIHSYRRHSGEGWNPLLSSSFRRRPESILILDLAMPHRVGFSPPFWTLTRRPTHVPVFFRPPSWRSGHFSLLAQREVTKRKAPSRPRSPMEPATSQARSGGSLTAHPCADSERVRILHTPLRAFSSTGLPRPRGTRKSKAKLSS